MKNFFEVQSQTTNPFAQENLMPEIDMENKQTQPQKRLNIVDMDVLNGGTINSQIEFIELKMNTLQKQINQHPQTLNPIELEKVKMEWEDLRLKLYKLKQNNKKNQNDFQQISKMNFITKKLAKINIFAKLYSPKLKKVVNSFKEINSEVEELLKKATPVGEENIKYGLLVNKLYQASKLNCEINYKMK